jgi:hypothetical protein
MLDLKKLSDQVRQTAYEIHVYLGHGHLEKAYESSCEPASKGRV